MSKLVFRLWSFPKVVRLHAENSQADAKFGCPEHEFLLLLSLVELR